MKTEFRRATEAEVEKYLAILRDVKPRNLCEQVARDQDLKYIPMSNDALYHHFMDNP